ncbi:MAG: hypothetical protein FH751_02960 [Firmicutes bacterium]|nr:hypothetical protein [Bacillota bacterium]
MKERKNNSELRLNTELENPNVKHLNIGKMKFQNEVFGNEANNKFTNYMQEMIGVVGIKDNGATYRIDYDSNSVSKDEVMKATEHFKNLF